MIKAVIFDMDGVLIDAKEWHYEALNSALNLFGYNISREDHLEKFDGLPTLVKLKTLSEETSLPKGTHELINEMKQHYTRQIAEAKCKPVYQHERALTKLKQDGLLIAVASNSVRDSIELMMDRSGLAPLLDLIVSNQDVKKPKPDPEMYLTAMKTLDIEPHECLVVEDHPRGVQAAREAGANIMRVETVDDVTLENIYREINKVNDNTLRTVSRIEDMFKGWFVGNFKPNVYQTKEVEIAVKNYKRGDTEARHFHKIATEITVIASGLIEMNGDVFAAGNIITLKPFCETDFRALTDVVTVCVKIPGANNDKYICKEDK